MAMRMLLALLSTIAVTAAVGVTVTPLAEGAPLQASAAGRSAETREQTMRRVVRTWSRRLNAGDNAGIAQLFRTPAIFVQGTHAYRLDTAKQIAIWHSALPCSGRVTSIRIAGRFATATFVLGNRKGSRCDAPGATVAARFEIVRGKIVSWVQFPEPVPGAPGKVA